MAKRKGNRPVYKKKKTEEEIRLEREAAQKEQHRKENVTKHSAIIVAFSTIFVIIAFIGRWVYAVQDGFYDSYVLVDDSVDTAISGATGLSHTEDETAALVSLGTQWDLFKNSRLCDELNITTDDGISLHGYLYDNGSDITVMVLQRFGLDGEDDFLPGSVLYDETGCNILIIEARCHGKSGGEVFGWGYFEQNDISDWCENTDALLGEQKYIIWGEGVGANTALFADANDLLPDNVCGIVAESPYGSVHKLASRNIFKWYAVPGFPFLTAIEARVNLTDNSLKVSDANLLNIVEDKNISGDVPVLFLSSSGDEYIPADHTKELYDGFNAENKSIITGTGTHGTVFSECGDEIMDWIKGRL